MSNRVDPDETAHYEPSHQDLHCLHRCLLWSAGLKVLYRYVYARMYIRVTRSLLKAVLTVTANNIVYCVILADEIPVHDILKYFSLRKCGWRSVNYLAHILSRLLLAWHDTGIWFSFRSFVRQSVNICVNSVFDPNVQGSFPKSYKGYIDDTWYKLAFRDDDNSDSSIHIWPWPVFHGSPTL